MNERVGRPTIGEPHEKSATRRGGRLRNSRTVAGTVAIAALLATLMPFSSDMYLAHLPDLAEDLGLDAVGTQLTLTGFLLGVAVGQLGWGAISDRAGRRAPLITSLAVYIVACVIAAIADVGWLVIVSRFMQGVGASAGLVLGRAIARDLTTGRGLARALSFISLAMAVAPIIAPIIGGALVGHGGWRVVMLLLACFGAVQLAVVWALLPESHRDVQVGKPTGRPFSDPVVRRAAMVLTFQYGVLFAYISSSATVLRGVYGLEGTSFGLVLAINSIALAAGALLNAKLTRRFRLVDLLVAAGGISAFASIVLTVVSFGWETPPLALFVALAIIACAPMTSITANASAAALEAHPAHAGGVSAVMGFAQFLFASLVSLLVAVGGAISPLSAAVVMACCGTAAAVAAIALRRASNSTLRAVVDRA